MNGKGYNVQIEALRGYNQNLKSFKEQSEKFDELVQQADVSDEAWGVVGLFTKQQYSSSLEELLGLMKQLKEGLDSSAAKILKAAEIYESADKQGSVLLGGQLVDIDKVKERPQGI